MENKLVTVIYDRRKLSAKKGMGYLEVRVNLGHKVRKYITLCYTSPDEWEKEAASDEAKLIIKKCEDILIAMSVLGEESNIENFNKHYSGEEKKAKQTKAVDACIGNVPHEETTDEEPDTSKKSFLKYMEIALDAEELREGTRKHKKCVIDAVRAFGKLNTYGDLTAKKIMAFDTWLHNGTRTDVTCYG